MTLNEQLEQEAHDSGLKVHYKSTAGEINGLLVGSHIIIKEDLSLYQKNTVLRHEIEHADTCPINLVIAPKPLQDKFERIADRKSVFKLVPIKKLIKLYDGGVRAADELSEALEVDIPFMFSALKAYQEIFGNNCEFTGRKITFLPLKIE